MIRNAFSLRFPLSIRLAFLSIVHCLFFFPLSGAGLEEPFETISEELSLLLSGKENICPAISIATINPGGISSIGAAGMRKIGNTEKVELDDKFHLGSCTKSMTAVLGAILVKEGLLKWDTKVVDVFEDIDIHSGYHNATLLNLLGNTAGCPKKVPASLWSKLWSMEPDPIRQRRNLAVGILKMQPCFKPGTSYEYSNAGFAIAGHMMEKSAGIAFEELIVEKLFKPLEMHSAGFGPPATRGKIDHPYGHLEKNSQLLSVDPHPMGDNPVAITPAGRVHCSIKDFAKFARLFLSGHEGINLTSNEIKFLLKADLPNHNYAKGFFIVNRDWGKGNVFMHTGSNTMFYSVMWIAPKIDFAIVAACNSGDRKAYEFMDSIVWKYIQEFKYELIITE